MLSVKSARTEAERANKEARESRYARLNWHAHVVPVVEESFAAFCSTLNAARLSTPFISRLSDAQASAPLNEGSEEIWGDSITISFGARPIPIRAVIPVKGRLRVLSEVQAALVISQIASTGAVIALLYPPKSEISRPEKPYFVARYFRDPRDIRRKNVMSLLNETLHLDCRCASVVSSTRRCARLIARLRAREEAFSGRPSKLWGWARYMYLAIRALFTLIRNAHTIP